MNKRFIISCVTRSSIPSMNCGLVGASILAALVPACTSDPDSTHIGEASSEILDVFVGPTTEQGAICATGSTYSHTATFEYGGTCTVTTTLPNSIITVTGPSVNATSTTGSVTLGDIPASSTQNYTVTIGSSVPVSGCAIFSTTAQCTDPIHFWTNFISDGGDATQCNEGPGYGLLQAALNDWTDYVRIDTDGRDGGCVQQFGVTDPASLLTGLSMSISFVGTPGGDPTQCEGVGYPQLVNAPIPIATSTKPFLSTPYRIDTDSRAGGCIQTFSMSGRDDVQLDVDFFGDGDASQCLPNTGPLSGVQTVSSTNSVSRTIDTDSRSGGCLERFRLHRPFR